MNTEITELGMYFDWQVEQCYHLGMRLSRKREVAKDFMKFGGRHWHLAQKFDMRRQYRFQRDGEMPPKVPVRDNREIALIRWIEPSPPIGLTLTIKIKARSLQTSFTPADTNPSPA